MFCVHGFLSFFPLQYIVFLGVFVLKTLTILSLEPLTLFLTALGI